MHRALYRAGGGDRRRPDHPQRDTVLAAVKAWPGGGRDRRPGGATAILDGVCARRHPARAGRDEETALGSNKETSHKDQPGERSTSLLVTPCGRPSTASGPAASTPIPKRTSDVLPKPDNFKSYRQNKARWHCQPAGLRVRHTPPSRWWRTFAKT